MMSQEGDYVASYVALPMPWPNLFFVCPVLVSTSSHDYLFHTLSVLTLLGMRLGPFHIVGFSVFALLSWVTQSSQLSRLGHRDLTQLSTEQIEALANSVDPIKNIDTQNPDSHLSKLLIPRPGTLCIFRRRSIFFDAKIGSWKSQLLLCPSIHYRCTESFELARRRG